MQIGFSARKWEKIFRISTKTKTGLLAVNYAQMSAVSF
jgi:hypothetical protein